MAEIDDALLARYRELEKLVGETQSNPEARKHLDKAIKTVRPNIETEEDIAERYAGPMRAQMEALEKRHDDYVKAQEERAAKWREQSEKQSLDDAFGTIKTQGKYTDESMEAIKKLMVDRGNPDPWAAAALFDKLNPPMVDAPTSSYEPQRWMHIDNPDDSDLKAIFQDSEGWSDRQIKTTLREMRSGQVH